MLLMTLAGLVLAGGGPACTPADAKNPQWATRLVDDEIPNFHRINPGLYRGAEPTDEGFARLAAMGIKTVVNLRRQHDKRQLVEGLGMQYVEIKTAAWGVHQEQQAIGFLRVVNDPCRAPVFVYCAFGSDRTGTMVAVYRLCVCGWTKEQALAEMRDEQFEFHELWDDLTTLIQDLDVPAISKAGREVRCAQHGSHD